ncbi:MAG: PDZ domain-containing protein, partial [Acidobacteriota bacterium]|nr:PDZ domain-containing protein [Acidobacteriota bacterium]
GQEQVTPHQLVVAICRCGGATGSPPWAVTMVHQVGTAATLDGGPALVDAIEAQMPLGPAASGSVILDDEGQVLGVLDGERTAGSETFGYFVPAGLAVGVAQELAAAHRVTRGWLGVVCEDDGVAGATVTTVLPGSPAAGAGLHPGDVVEAVGSHRVGSLADLEALLYTTPPGSRLTLSVQRGGSVRTAQVTLASSPS